MNDELLKALNVIKEECKKHKNCIGCPLINSCGDCGVQEDAPDGWLLQERVVYF